MTKEEFLYRVKARYGGRASPDVTFQMTPRVMAEMLSLAGVLEGDQKGKPNDARNKGRVSGSGKGSTGPGSRRPYGVDPAADGQSSGNSEGDNQGTGQVQPGGAGDPLSNL